MQILETSAKPRMRSDVALLNSAASSRPRSMAATISPPGSALTAAPMPWNTSIEMPTVRNFRPLQVLGLGDRLLEPAERLGRHRPVGERHDVGADRGVELLEQLLAAAVLVPGQQHVGVHGVARARAPQRQRRLLAVVIDEHAVAAVERALGHRFEQAEGRHHGAGRQHLDLEIAAGHVVDLLGEVERVFVEDVLRRPGALPAHADRALRLDDGGGGDGSDRRRPRPSETCDANYAQSWLYRSLLFPPKVPMGG